MALGKFHPVDVPVWGEIGVTAKALLENLQASTDIEDQRAEIAERWQIWRAEKQKRRQEDSGKGLNSALVFDALTACAPDDAIIAVDVGNNAYSFGRYFECVGQKVLLSGYLGSIGFALPAAMGAWAATQDFEGLKGRKIISVSGDGGLGQYLAEFTTAVKYGMDITHIVLNNNEIAKISKEQRAGNWQVWATSLTNPSFAGFARNCGGHGVRVNKIEELAPAIREALDFEGPAMVEIMTDANLV
jgi:thiamine pyrophosphate-dependent acetolactate synthase large subunit-like protein